jgi:chromosome segregation ATPase
MSEDGNDFLSLMKKKHLEEGKPSLVGEALDTAEKAKKRADELELEHVIITKKDKELEEKVQELENENSALKEKIERTIALLTKSEEAINQALEDKKRIDQEKTKEIVKLGLQISDLQNAKKQLTNRVQEFEAAIAEYKAQFESESSENPDDL